jgi:acetyl esterase
MHPRAKPSRHGVDVLRDIAYCDSGLPEHRLDVYLPPPRNDGEASRRPALMYVHGGGFRILSKDTHWLMGLAFARAGYVVFNVSYRLAPRHRFPVPLQDVATAYRWVVEHAQAYGSDASRLVLAGESAGANLVSALTVMACYRRNEPWARQLFDCGVAPKAFMPYCGLLQVTDIARFRRRKPTLRTLVNDRLVEVSDAYLGRNARLGSERDLVDPLLVFERGEKPDRPLPPCFATVGTADPLLDDTRRLGAALDRAGVPNEVIFYPREVHAFHAMIWRKSARRCWKDSFRFLDQWVTI